MNLTGRFWMLAVATSLALPHPSLGCSTLFIPQSQAKVFGKSYDWHQNHGVALTNLRNVSKVALTLNPADQPARWTSRYGSLTFNQHGRELPLGGINETGLTVEIMWLDSSIYPAVDTTPALSELQWIQYILDTSKSVSEASAQARAVRVNPVTAKVHYLVCDPSGACATFEYIDRSLVIHEGTKASIPALTNSPYAQSVAYLPKFVGFGGQLPLPGGTGSLERFARVANAVKSYDESTHGDAVAYAFAALSDVEQANYTTWNLVYETARGRAHFRTQGSPNIGSIDATAFDYSCRQANQVLDLKTHPQGDTNAQFKEFTAQDNLALVTQGLAPFAQQMPPGTAQKVAAYPAVNVCTE